MTVIGLNRALFVHKPDVAILSSDPLVSNPRDFSLFVQASAGIPIIAPDILGVSKVYSYIENAKTLSKHRHGVFLFKFCLGRKQFTSEYLTKHFPATWFYSYRTVLCSAIEIARFFGVRRVHVFGHDAQPRGDKIYCSERVRPDKAMLKNTKGMFERMVAGVQFGFDSIWNGRIEVTNYCSDSETTCFQRVGIDDYPS